MIDPLCFRYTFKSRDNQLVVDILVKEVKGQNPTFSTQYIKGYQFSDSALSVW